MAFISCIKLYTLFYTFGLVVTADQDQGFSDPLYAFFASDDKETPAKRQNVFFPHRDYTDFLPSEIKQCILEKEVPKFSETNLALSMTLLTIQMLLALALIYSSLRMWYKILRLAIVQMRREREREILYPMKREHLTSRHFLPLEKDNMPKRRGAILVPAKTNAVRVG
uniref:Uncharacterized protein n=1 Tax=Panagrellus redivivus TaxID=6233 RepID=A0A7E4ZQX8_PANRE